MSQRFGLPVAVFLILIKDDTVLLSRRQNSSWYNGSYDLVAGHIDGGESLTAALLREAKEEIGITIAPKDAKFAHISHAFFTEDGKEYIYALFEVRKWQGEPQIMEPDKCDQLLWAPLGNLPDNLTPGTRAGLKAYASGKPYSESGFPGTD